MIVIVRLVEKIFSKKISDCGVGRALALVAIAAPMTGCAGFLPLDAPDAVATYSHAALITGPTAPLPYALIPVNPDILRATNSITDGPNSSFAQIPGSNYRDVPIGVGDILAVTVFEAQAGGLFIPREASVRPGNFVDLPRQQVDQSGSINIPYAGSIKVAGLTPRSVSSVIRERLKDRAIDPQAVVSVAEQRGLQVSVLGEVNSPLRFPIDPGGIHLLAAIARGGGPKYPAYEIKITLKRNGRTYDGSMSSVVHRPSEDILLAPGDVVFLTRVPRVFMVFGSTPLRVPLAASTTVVLHLKTTPCRLPKHWRRPADWIRPAPTPNRFTYIGLNQSLSWKT